MKQKAKKGTKKKVPGEQQGRVHALEDGRSRMTKAPPQAGQGLGVVGRQARKLCAMRGWRNVLRVRA